MCSVQTDAFPRMVILEYSYVCNSICPSCPYNHNTVRQRFAATPYMRADVFINVVRQCAGRSVLLRITGCGEPTLHPRIAADVALAKNHGIKVALITNGTMSHELMEQLTPNLHTIEFSVDAGTPEEYARVRPGLNFCHLYSVVQQAVKCDHLRVIASAIEQRGVDIDAVRTTWDFVDHVQIRRYLTWGTLNPANSANIKPLLEKGRPCPQPFQRFSIAPDGSISLCNEDSAFSHLVGHVNGAGIEGSWKSTAMEIFRSRHLNGNLPAFCRGCYDRQFKSWNSDYFAMVGESDVQ